MFYLASLLLPKEERVIRRAARAQHAYWQMVHSSDDQRRRLAMMDRHNAITAELQGRQPPARPPDLSEPLEAAVRHELVAITPAVRQQLIVSRQTRRLAVDCGPAQISLSVTASARRQLREIVQSSHLSIREIALALGVATRTLERHCAGETMSRERRDWYRRLIRVEVNGPEVHVVTRRPPPTRKPWGWNLSREEKRRLIAGER